MVVGLGIYFYFIDYLFIFFLLTCLSAHSSHDFVVPSAPFGLGP